MSASDAGAGPVRARVGTSALRRRLPAPEVGAVLALAAVLDLWGLSVNGWANTYYSAAVRSMVQSWHNFLFAAMDPSGLMTVDKPPLALWIQTLSARVFGLHPLSLLVPQALMGVAATAFVLDLTKRRFGRAAGAVAGLTLAAMPIIVAVSRHNNPDELLVLLCTAALWCTVRALEDGRLTWLASASVCVGLGFETKMLVAFMVVPGIAAAWLWSAPVPRRARIRRLLAAAVPGALVAAAWPLLITLTPAPDRPWISGTADNSVWSLIFGYNGLGRVAGQAGGPGGVPGGTVFGGATGPLRLLQAGLGDQAGWWVGAAIASAIVLVVTTRLRRRDPRTGWVIALGGALVVPAAVFSFAEGIFHPYYVSLLGPSLAALTGAGTAFVLPRRLGGVGEGRSARVAGPAVLLAGALTEQLVLGGLRGQLGWGRAAVAVAGLAAVALAFDLQARLRAVLAGVAFLALLAAPVVWATDTLGHAASATFPAGGPLAADRGPGGPGGLRRPFAGGPGPGFPPPPGGGTPGGPPGLRAPGGPARLGAPDAGLAVAVAYARSHGGGTVVVESQSGAASAIVRAGADVAGLGGFSGRESTVTARWLADEVAARRMRWVLTGGSGAPRLGGDTRSGSTAAFAAAHRACRAVGLPAIAPAVGPGQTDTTTLVDCAGRAAAIVRAAAAG